MGKYVKGLFKMGFLMEKLYANGQMEVNMKEILLMKLKVDKDVKALVMEVAIKESIWMENLMDLAFTLHQIMIPSKDTGNRIF